MSNSELATIVGGATNLNGNFLGAIVRVFTTFLEIGRSIGTFLYSYKTGRKC